MYNCGNALCNTVIRIGGSVGAGGLVITNETNGSKCKLSSLPSSGYLEIDSYYGTVTHVQGTAKALDYQYHDEGFLSLDSCGIVMKDIGLFLVSNTKEVRAINDVMPDSCVGRYLWVRNGWHKITGYGEDAYSLTIEDNMTTTGYYAGIIATMNKIVITGTSISLNTFSIESNPVIE